jgi:hypothetical protein
MTTKRYPRSASYSSQFHQSNQGLSVQIPTGFTRGTTYPDFTWTNFPAQFKHNFTLQPGGDMSGKEGPKPNQALVPIMKISQAQMEERRRKGLCYSCDSKWTRGHVCVVPKLFLIEVLNEDTTEPAKALGPAEDDLGEFFLEEFPEISLNAITGTPSPKTMRLIGFCDFSRLLF